MKHSPTNVQRILVLLELEGVDISDTEIPDRIWDLEPEEAVLEIIELINQ